MPRISARLPAVAALALLAACTVTPGVISGPRGPAALPPDTVWLDQNWSDEDRDLWWFTGQGSHMIPYDWFLALPGADGKPFRADPTLAGYGFLTTPATVRNPDALPVGFVKDQRPATDIRGQWLGMTCAACHTAQLRIKGVEVRVDGGPGLVDFDGFMNGMVAAMDRAAASPDAFSRFAAEVLGSNATPEKLADLRTAFGEHTQFLKTRIAANAIPRPAGHGRVDAFGQIFNQAVVHALGVPGNAHPADAPVSYPFIWDAPQHDRLQWNGSALNVGAGPLARNSGEVVGVFGTVNVNQPGFGMRGYASSLDTQQLDGLERLLTTLWSPEWPSKYAGPLDATLVARGKTLFAANCAGCHQNIDAKGSVTFDRADPNRRITAQMIDLGKVGTDPHMAKNVLACTADTGPLNGRPVAVLPFGPKLKPKDLCVNVTGNVVVGAILGNNPPASLFQVLEFLKGSQALKAKLMNPQYKARPLNGIWATAPYLHNGSVPTLADLLQPPAQRPKTFHVGDREFDAGKVGYVTDRGPFVYDTAEPGNSNAGHLYGTKLATADKRALLEYLKSL
ncbi:MAG TPA: di-heme-cytochrome C peroxidase [Plasticicumulans sp.]|nr:di-heme-cytochrome C peroxidase [Plasticicumulans sp.]